MIYKCGLMGSKVWGGGGRFNLSRFRLRVGRE